MTVKTLSAIFLLFLKIEIFFFKLDLEHVKIKKLFDAAYNFFESGVDALGGVKLFNNHKIYVYILKYHKNSGITKLP